jgi:hypothetical protein
MSDIEFDEPPLVTDEEKLAILKREQAERDRRWKRFSPTFKKQLDSFRNEDRISKQSPNKIPRK